MKKSDNIERMDSFIKWMKETVQSVHTITDDMFIEILEKI